MKKRAKVGIFVLIFVLCAPLVASFNSCSTMTSLNALYYTCRLLDPSTKASSYTTEEHIQRITSRLDRYDTIGGYSGNSPDDYYEDFDVYPLYDANDTIKWFLVEYQPQGFMFVSLHDEHPLHESLLDKWIGVFSSMYRRGIVYRSNREYYPYIYDPENALPGNNNRVYFYDEEGQRIGYNRSPYFITGKIAEKKYLLETSESSEYICAVKRGDEFINLLSGATFCLEDDDAMSKQSVLYVPTSFSARGDL